MVRGQSLSMGPWQRSMIGAFHGQARPASRAGLTAPPHRSRPTWRTEGHEKMPRSPGPLAAKGTPGVASRDVSIQRYIEATNGHGRSQQWSAWREGGDAIGRGGYIGGRPSVRQRSTNSSITAVPTHMTLSAPPQ